MMPCKTDQKKLLFYINAVSFAALDANLFLDTHPDNADALQYFSHFNGARSQALKEYASRFGPLTTEYAGEGNRWKWALQPWPWEMEG